MSEVKTVKQNGLKWFEHRVERKMKTAEKVER